jgi:hypothetical protein
MSERPRARCCCYLCSVLIALLLCGCNAAEGPGEQASTDVHQGESDGADAASSVVAHSETHATPTSKSEAGDEAQVRQARIAQVTADLGAAQAQQADLMRKQGEVSARLEAHHEEGMALLASLKSEMEKQRALEAQAAREGTDARAEAARIDALDERLSEQARSKLEPALARDQALFAELEAVSAELESVTSRIEGLRAELAALNNADAKSASGEPP